MKRFVSIVMIAAMCAALLVGCGAEEKTEHAEYTVYNSTGAKVTELYLYNAGSSKKGENLAGNGFADGASLVITRDETKKGAEEAVYVLEFKAEDMSSSQKFETLHFEVAPIYLLSVDAAAGATPISFKAPAKAEEVKEHAEYTVYNSTGAKLTELYLYNVGSSDKGENLAGAGLEKGAKVVITRDLPSDETKAVVYCLEFKAEDMPSSQKYETLHFEVAPISLLSIDAAAGATPIKFKVPMEHAEYTVYNSTGATVTELYLYNVGSSDKGENLAGAGLEKGAKVVITRDLPSDETKAVVYCLEFKAEDMPSSQKYETLHFEVAPISLLSIDAAAGATPIKFKVAMEHAEYTVYNSTGATVTELYLYDAGSADKGENLAGKGLAAGASIVLTRDLPSDQTKAAVYVLEFKAENMTSSQKFETLHFEVAPINLLSIDAAAGATPIKFKKP
ncbi:MAG: hypothetical protein MJ113_00740 [Lachnospiraceae bacterium]|nr:hypothetical protein [Lachnospiraceae bacterium]